MKKFTLKFLSFAYLSLFILVFNLLLNNQNLYAQKNDKSSQNLNKNDSLKTENLEQVVITATRSENCFQKFRFP